MVLLLACESDSLPFTVQTRPRPLYFAGPGLPAGGRIDHARLVDVMPTVLDLLGEAARLNEIGPIDGVSIAAELKAAQPKATPADAKAVKASDQN